MRLGNDIVDLNFVQDHHPRFIQRILNPSEIERFPEAGRNPGLLWSLWAAKEAAYKAIKQTEAIGFHHREFVIAADCASIQFLQQNLQLKLHCDGDLVLAIATDGELDAVRTLMFRAELEITPSAQSRQSKELLRTIAAQSLGVDPQELRLISKDRIPRIQWQGKTLNNPASCTHHGRFLAASFGISGDSK